MPNEVRQTVERSQRDTEQGTRTRSQGAQADKTHRKAAMRAARRLDRTAPSASATDDRTVPECRSDKMKNYTRSRPAWARRIARPKETRRVEKLQRRAERHVGQTAPSIECRHRASEECPETPTVTEGRPIGASS